MQERIAVHIWTLNCVLELYICSASMHAYLPVLADDMAAEGLAIIKCMAMFFVGVTSFSKLTISA